jgi:hypothetical protein
VKDNEGETDTATCSYYVIEPKLTIHDSTGDPLHNDDEYTVGAFVEVGELRYMYFQAEPALGPPETGHGEIKLEIVNGCEKIKVWTDQSKSAQYETGRAHALNEVVELYVEGVEASEDLRDVELRVFYVYDNQDLAYDRISLTIFERKKIALGGSADLFNCSVAKACVPTAYGGNIELSGRNIELYFTNGDDLDSETARKIVNGELESNRVAQGNPCAYAVPGSPQYRWFYAKITGAPSATVTVKFWQSKTVTKQPWSCPWYPISEEGYPNLYGPGKCLEKYDTAYGTAAKLVEKRNAWIGGCYLAKNTLMETDAEQTVGYDFDNADGDNNEWTGWGANVQYDFWNGDPPGGGMGPPGDGDTNDVVDVSWWGHCDMRTAAVICENAPAGNYNAPNGVVFTPALKKGLLVALYHGFVSVGRTGPDIKPHEWQDYLEIWILTNDRMFACDIYNYGEGPDTVWFYPIYAIEKAEFKQKLGQDDENVVEIKCECKYWSEQGNSLYYLYNVTYQDGGAADSDGADWLEHPLAPPNHRSPDTVWRPTLMTGVSGYWAGQLDYNTIRDIIPEPQE